MEEMIRIFKSLEEQEADHFQQMKNTTVEERFRRLFLMQQITRKFHPVADHTRKIIIRNGPAQQGVSYIFKLCTAKSAPLFVDRRVCG